MAAEPEFDDIKVEWLKTHKNNWENFKKQLWRENLAEKMRERRLGVDPHNDYKIFGPDG